MSFVQDWHGLTKYFRERIASRELGPGDKLPTEANMVETFGLSRYAVRRSLATLAAEGLIIRIPGNGPGRGTIVRESPKKVVRSSTRHQLEKSLVLSPQAIRSSLGQTEINQDIPVGKTKFHAEYRTIKANEDLAERLLVEEPDYVLQRTFTTSEKSSGHLLAFSVSYLPLALVERNPELLDAGKEPWPGGTQHQLHTVGIEVATVIDEVDARLMSDAERHDWGIQTGAPPLLYVVRCTLIGSDGRVVETSDAHYPVDRTYLRFTTPLDPRQ